MTELNATVDQLSVSVNEIAQNATQLAGVVADTKEDSDKVEDKMRTTVEVSAKFCFNQQRIISVLSKLNCRNTKNRSRHIHRNIWNGW